MTIGERQEGRSSQADLLALFAVLWALAAVWHLLGNTGTAPAWAQAVLVVGIGLTLIRPGAVLPLSVLAVGGLLTMWEEAPLLGNHWLLAGFVDLTILLAAIAGVVRRRAGDRTGLAERVFPAARLCLLGFYVFAGFAKLNLSFFDRSVSCAAFYLKESTASIGLHGLLPGSASVEWAAIVGTALIELSIPVLLIRRRTRAAGVMLGLVFHALLAIDRRHEFFDFSAVLFALFVLFLPPTSGTWVAERVGSIRARLALRDDGLPDRVHLALLAVPLAAAALVVVDVA
ncbi:MAG: HTTM domain-containing protein, partial [Acidimicrobiales bacterium]